MGNQILFYRKFRNLFTQLMIGIMLILIIIISYFIFPMKNPPIVYKTVVDKAGSLKERINIQHQSMRKTISLLSKDEIITTFIEQERYNYLSYSEIPFKQIDSYLTQAPLIEGIWLLNRAGKTILSYPDSTNYDSIIESKYLMLVSNNKLVMTDKYVLAYTPVYNLFNEEIGSILAYYSPQQIKQKLVSDDVFIDFQNKHMVCTPNDIKMKNVSSKQLVDFSRIFSLQNANFDLMYASDLTSLYYPELRGVMLGLNLVYLTGIIAALVIAYRKKI